MSREKAELDRRLREEEEARQRHAEEADAVGNKDRIGVIIDTLKPVAGVAKDVVGGPTQDELAAKAAADAEEQARRDKAALESAAARAREEVEKAAALKAKAEADEAERAAKDAEAKAKAEAAQYSPPKDDRRQESVKWDWTIDDIKVLCRQVADGKVDPGYIGFDVRKPEKFRPGIITREVNRLQDMFHVPGIKVFKRLDTRFLAAEAETVVES